MSLATLIQYNQAKIVNASPNDELYDPAAMQAFLDYASKYLESQTYRTLELAAVTETLQVGSLYCNLAPGGGLNIFPKQFPVVAISALSYRYLPSADFTDVDTDLWSFTQEGDQITLPYEVPVPNGRWAQIRLSYSAGYAEGEIPDDLIMACIVIAANFSSFGYGALDIGGRPLSSVLPKSAFDMVNQTIGRYKRQF